ncbi:MAG: AAA family ATPase [Desulfobacteraceae bacterium]|nr:AAA family ATPase [Desulfobacteraceae bacterium]MBC2758053.1 AAA family ATPase [Desulfobacteraceae bacterium]
MKCPKCQRDNPKDAKYCNECAHPLQTQEQAPPIDFDQPHSYTPKFLADKILTTRSAMEGERKRVTVLFADVAGFTSMSEKLDPEQVHQIMDGCFKILMDEIHNHQGTINQFTGDGVMALFGAPVAIENHAQNACQAALTIQSSIKRYSEELEKKYGFDFTMRIGLNSGPVIVGSIGDDLRMDYTAIGDTTNLAARMESMAEPGSIFVSPVTYKRVSQQFNFNPLGEAKVKGKEEPLDVYELVDQIDKPGAGMDRQIFSEMVGREKDLDKLELQVMKAINGEGSIVNIIGEAGIGKSRLVSELRNREMMKRVTLLEGRAISIGRNLSFHPIINLLKHWSHIKDDDTAATAFRKLETAVSRVCHDDTNEILPFVATLMGMKLSGRYAESMKGIEGEALEKQIIKHMKDLLIKTTDLTPLVLVAEDLHWADTSTIELLESLSSLSETRRIVFVNVFRPYHKETGDRIIETFKERHPEYYVEITLQPLNEQHTESLINSMLNIKGLYHGVKEKIIRRAGGNPFFIEEVVRSFIDEGAVVKTNGTFEVTDKIEKMVIPHTINDVLMARIDRLDDKTRDLVKVASVIGRSFFYRVLNEVAQAINDIDSRLSYLTQIQLIRERRRLEELEYLFKHALAQEAAYESILLQNRKKLHLTVADAIEKVFTEKLHEFYGMLAYHYTQGEDEEKTEKYLIKAGEEALKSSASSEALHYFHVALELYLKKYGESVDPEKVAMIEKNIAQAYFNKGQFPEAVEYLSKVLAFYGETEPSLSISGIIKLFFRFLFLLAGLYLPFVRWKKTPSKQDCEISYLAYQKVQCLNLVDVKRFVIEAINHSKRVISFDISKLKKGIETFTGLSTLFSYGGISFRLSRKMLEVVKEKINKKDTYSVLVYELCAITNSFLSGNWKSIKEYDDDLVSLNLKTIDIITIGFVYLHLLLKIEQGDYGKAKELVDKLTEIGEIYGHEHSIFLKYFGNAFLLMKHRKLREAMIEVNEGLNFTIKAGMAINLLIQYSLKARIQMMMGDLQEAENALQYAKEIESEIYTSPFLLHTFLLSPFMFNLFKLEHAIKTENAADVAAFKMSALKAGKKMFVNTRKVARGVTETYKLMGVYYWLINKQKKALKWWRGSIKAGEQLGDRLELSRTYFEIGKRLLEPNSKYKELNNITADEYLEKARAMFEVMDLQWDLNELDKVMPPPAH